MIDRCTIKFGPAVSQKELEKLLTTGEGEFQIPQLKMMKARIEVVGDFEDLKKICRDIENLVLSEQELIHDLRSA